MQSIKNTGKRVYWIVSDIVYPLHCGWNRWVQKYKPLQIFPKNLLLVLFLFGSLITIYNQYQSHRFRIIYDNDAHYQIAHEPIYKRGITFSLDRPGVKKTINSIAIKFGTYNRINEAQYKLNILKNKKLVYTMNIQARDLQDNQYSFHKIPEIEPGELSQYQATLEPVVADERNSVTVYSDKNNEIAIRLAKQSSRFDVEFFVFITLIILMFLMFYVINTHKVGELKAYLVIGLLLSVTTIVTPPYQVPDEVEHFLRTLNLSQYNFQESPYNNISSANIYFPDYQKLDYSNVNKDNHVEIDGLIKSWEVSRPIKVPYGKKQQTPNLAIAYLIPAVFVKIASVISNSAMFIFLTGRLGSYLVNFWLTYLAIKITPKYKKIFLFVATMPMVFQTMGSYSYDGILNAMCILFMALTMRCISERKPIKVSTMLYMLLLISLITIIKVPYVLLGSVVFFIPKENFSNKRVNKWLYIIIGVVLTLMLYEMNIIFFNIGNKGTKAVAVINNNLSFLMANPFRIFPILINTMIIYGNFYILSIVGYFGWFYINMDPIFKYAMFGIVIGLLGSQKSILSWKQKTFLLIMIIGVALGIFLALYFAWTPYKLMHIEGVQGRYFIPLLIPLALTAMSKKQWWLLTNETLYSYITVVLAQYILLLVVHFY